MSSTVIGNKSNTSGEDTGSVRPGGKTRLADMVGRLSGYAILVLLLFLFAFPFYNMFVLASHETIFADRKSTRLNSSHYS